MFRLVWYLVQAVFRVSFRRLRRGPRRPRWRFGFEVLVEAMRQHSRWLGSLSIPALRQAAASLGGRTARGVTPESETRADVLVTRYRPEGGSAEGILLYVHGGGYVFGSAAQDAGIASRLATLTRRPVVAPDYRLAPENPVPEAVDDLVAVHRTLGDEGHDVTFVGLSAGAGIALSAMVRLRDEGAALPSRAVLLSPMVDARGERASWRANRDLDWGAAEAVLRWARLYAGERPLDDPQVSPIDADLAGLPPLLVVAGEVELLRDAEELVGRATRAGVDAQLHLEPDMVHAYMTFGLDDAPTRRTLERITQFLAPVAVHRAERRRAS